MTGVGAWALTVGPVNADTKKLPMTTEAIPTENFRTEKRWTVLRLLELLDFFIEFFPFLVNYYSLVYFTTKKLINIWLN